MQGYPRDLIGYGRTPPHAAWPNGARIALQIVMNYEEGGEASVLHGDPASETFLNELVGGPSGGLDWLDDSNVDWGQDLPGLAAWQERTGEASVRLRDFGSGR